jgi:hypothetical protein
MTRSTVPPGARIPVVEEPNPFDSTSSQTPSWASTRKALPCNVIPHAQRREVDRRAGVSQQDRGGAAGQAADDDDGD